MQKTNLNVSPYYDDFSEDSLYHRVLFRPAYSVQARELTQMQTILQNQIERIGSHFFKEGSMVIPGQTGFDVTYSYVKLQTTFTVDTVTHTVENFRTSLIGKTLTGATSEVVAKVVGSQAADSTNDLTIFVKYEKSGTAAGGTTNKQFSNGEILKTDIAIGYTTGGTSYTLAAAAQVATTSTSAATGTGSSASVQKGIFYIRGAFVQCKTQTITLDAYSATPSYRIGFIVTESLVTPEEETALLDNATGSTNFAAKGAHRLKYILTLAKKALGTADDADFIELLSVREGLVQSQVRATEYSVLEDTLARRTYDESGDYVVRGFDIDIREHNNDGLNDGVFLPADGGDSSKIAIGLAPGKAYVRGYEIGTQGQTFIPLSKARSTAFIQNNPTTFSAGNYISVENAHGQPDISSDGSNSKSYKEVELIDRRQPVTHLNISSPGTLAASAVSIACDSGDYLPSSGSFIIQIEDELIFCDSCTAAGVITVNTNGRSYAGTTAPTTHPAKSPVYFYGADLTVLPRAKTNNATVTPRTKAKTIGVARTRAFETGVGAAVSASSAKHTRLAQFHHYIFDVRMLCKLTLADASVMSSSNFLHNGAKIKGKSSGATGLVYITPQDVQFTKTATTSTSAATLTSITNTGGLEVGMGVTGTGVATDTFITGITSTTAVTTNQNASAGAAVTCTFGNVDFTTSIPVSTGDGKKYDAGTTFHVIQTTGTFQKGEVITSNITQSSGTMTNFSTGTDGEATLSATVSSIYYSMSDVHSLYGRGEQNTGYDYRADICPKDIKKLTGSVSAAAAGVLVTGTNTQFASDFKQGDLFEVQDTGGTVRRMTVDFITSDVSLTTIETFPVVVTSSTILRKRSKIEEQEELVMISKLPKGAVKTLKATELNNKIDTTLTIRRQQTIQLAAGVGSITLPEGESFVSFNEDDYMISVVNQATGSTVANQVFTDGQMLKPKESGTGCIFTKTAQTITFTITGATTETVKIVYTAQIATANEKTKTLQPMSTLAISEAGGSVTSGGVYGTNYKDEDICLNKADIFKVRGVYMASDTTTAAVAPTMTYSSASGSNITTSEIFQPGEKITGSNGAIARIITGGTSGSTTATTSFSYLTTKTFTVGTTLTSSQNTFSYALTITVVTAGDENILSNYTFDTGMRDTYYDLGSLSKKSGSAPPTGKLLIVFDYFTHGAGNYFSVDSYPVGTSVASITYDEIPLYSAQRVDPDVISPTGEYDLRDSIDFRPRVADYAGTNVVSASVSISPLSFAKRDFTAGTASLVDIPKSDDTFLASFNYYLPQNAALWLDSEGEFRTVLGAAAENPEMPKPLDDAMQIAEFRLPPYVFSPQDIGMRKLKNRRFTMRDIGKINERVENLEYYSQLNMLEKDTESFQIQDADGLDRFKNGFIVDNFTGHSVGDGMHPDYKNSMDMANGILRPEFKHRMIELEEKVSTDSERTAVGYQRTGALITLPYTETEMVNQPYASRIENVNPFNVIAWVGSIALDPASDIWKDTNRMPNLVINREGNYDSFIARNGGSAVNTVWNEWETFWTGETNNSVQWRDTSWATARKQVPFRRVMERTVTTKTSKQSRQGVRTEITPRIDYESKGDKVVSTEILPYCRARDVNFTCRVFKPITRLFAFFDNVDVTQYCKPSVPFTNTYNALNGALTIGTTTITVNSTGLFSTSGSITIDDEIITYTNKSSTQFLSCTRGSGTSSAATHTDDARVYKTPAAGDPLITGATGKCAGVFSIPDPNTSGNPAFKTGERILRLTSMQDNGVLSGDVDTAGEATYYAKGLLDNIQESIIATRNADVNKVTVNENKTVSSTRVSDKQVGWWDPVAQSFLIDVKGGAFVTSVNCYFQAKSATVPVQCQMRTMKNGYPTTTILPFGTASVEPEDVQISEDATAPTLFTFPSPIYLLQDVEYCFVIMANTQDYLIWLSHMGDVEVGGTRTISDQPYAGVMFKSQNASTWSAAQMEDLKFTINRASFSLSPGTCTLQNAAIPAVALGQSPVMTINGTKKIKVRHLNHGMYDATGNKVTIAGLTGTVNYSGTGNYNIGTGLSTDGDATTGTGLNGTWTIAEVGIDHYIIDVTSALGGSSTFSETKVMGGSDATATENYMMDTGKTTLQLMEIGGTDVITKLRTTSATSPSGAAGVLGGSETSYTLTAGSSAVEVSPNENVNFTEPCMIASTVNEGQFMSQNKSFEVLATFTTPVENLTPVIDTQRMGQICIQNRLNNINVMSDLYASDITTAEPILADAYKTSTAADGDGNAAVYVTRKVSLANSSTSLKVMFDAIVFSSANIDVYFKVLKSYDTSPFENIEWTLMTIDKAVSESMSYINFRERTYEVAGFDSFIAFSVKIVMRGTKSTEPPFIQDLRVIALAL